MHEQENIYCSGRFPAMGTLAACGPNPADLNAAAQAKNVKAEQPVAVISGVDLKAIDNNVRPQDDFFKYANGSWLANNEIPADKSRFGMFIVVHDRTKDRLKAFIQESSEMKSEKALTIKS